MAFTADRHVIWQFTCVSREPTWAHQQILSQAPSGARVKSTGVRVKFHISIASQRWIKLTTKFCRKDPKEK